MIYGINYMYRCIVVNIIVSMVGKSSEELQQSSADHILLVWVWVPNHPFLQGSWCLAWDRWFRLSHKKPWLSRGFLLGSRNMRIQRLTIFIIATPYFNEHAHIISQFNYGSRFNCTFWRYLISYCTYFGMILTCELVGGSSRRIDNWNLSSTLGFLPTFITNHLVKRTLSMRMEPHWGTKKWLSGDQNQSCYDGGGGGGGESLYDLYMWYGLIWWSMMYVEFLNLIKCDDLVVCCRPTLTTLRWRHADSW